MNLKRLKHALYLSEELSFARAAEKLHITQSALSRSIQTLEQESKLQIFDRHASGVKVTTVGRQFLDKAQDLLMQAGHFEKEVALIRGAQLGSLRMGAGPLAVQSLLNNVLPVLMSRHPALQIHVEVQPAVALLELLLTEKLEFFIADTQQFASHPAIVMTDLLSLPIGLYARKAHPVFMLGPVKPEQLHEYTLASPTFLNEPVDKALNPYIRPVLQWPWLGHLSCENIDLLIATALFSDALLLTTELAIKQELSEGILKPVEWLEDPFDAGLKVKWVTLKARSPSPIARIVKTMVEEHLSAR